MTRKHTAQGAVFWGSAWPGPPPETPMHVTMVKKVNLDGSACKKCDQAEELFKRRGLWEKIDEVVWAKEADPGSPGMRLAERHRIELASHRSA